MEETRPGKYMPHYEDDCGAYILNSKDLCLIEYLPKLLKAVFCTLK